MKHRFHTLLPGPLHEPYGKNAGARQSRNCNDRRRNEKTLGFARNPRVFANRAGGIRTHDLYHPNEADDPKRTNENQGKTQGASRRLHQWLHLRPLFARTCRRFETAIIQR